MATARRSGTKERYQVGQSRKSVEGGAIVSTNPHELCAFEDGSDESEPIAKEKSKRWDNYVVRTYAARCSLCH
jgi:hypothetical protein